MYIGIETSELSDAECDRLMRDEWSWKLGSADEVEAIFRQALEGLGMEPLNRIPPTLPTGFVYFDITRNPAYWKDVVRTHTLGLRFRTTGAAAVGDQIIKLTDSTTGRTAQPSVRRICRQGTLNPAAWAFVLSIEEGSVR